LTVRNYARVCKSLSRLRVDGYRVIKRSVTYALLLLYPSVG
jgi:hypothetical protein